MHLLNGSLLIKPYSVCHLHRKRECRPQARLLDPCGIRQISTQARLLGSLPAKRNIWAAQEFTFTFTFLYMPFWAMQYTVQLPAFFPVMAPLLETFATEVFDDT